MFFLVYNEYVWAEYALSPVTAAHFLQNRPLQTKEKHHNIKIIMGREIFYAVQ